MKAVFINETPYAIGDDKYKKGDVVKGKKAKTYLKRFPYLFKKVETVEVVEPEVENTEEPQEEVEITELPKRVDKSYSIEDLQRVAKQLNIEIVPGWKKSDYITHINQILK